MATELLSESQPSGEAPARVKLRVGKDLAIPPVRQALERGLEVQALKVRNAADLEKARQQKLEWTQQANGMLRNICADESAAEEFNAWIGKVLPEFAELGLFIEQFYDEMEQRFRRLHGILKRIETEPDIVPRIVSGPQLATPTGAAVVVAGPASISDDQSDPGPAPSAHRVKEETSMSSGAATPFADAPANGGNSQPAHAPPPKPAPHPQPQVTSAVSAHAQQGHAPTQISKGSRSAVLIVRARNEAVEEAIAQLVTRLGFDMTLLFEQADGGKGVIQKIEKSPKVALALILANADDVSNARDPGAANQNGGHHPGGRAAFEVGYCAGRLGFNRVVVLHTAAYPVFSDDYGMSYIPVDPAEGWHLHLARHLKRAGMDVDLNRLA